jgi:hypothetical protein
VLRREESFSATLGKMLGETCAATWGAPLPGSSSSSSSVSSRRDKENKLYGDLIFSEPCLLLVTSLSSSASRALKSKPLSKNFTRHLFQVYSGQGYLCFHETKAQVASSQCQEEAVPHKCSKLLCSKFEERPAVRSEVLRASNFLPSMGDEEAAEVIIGIEMHSDGGDRGHCDQTGPRHEHKHEQAQESSQTTTAYM